MRLRKILADSGLIKAKYETRKQRAMRILNRYILLPISGGLFLLGGKCSYDKITTPQTPRITFDDPRSYSRSEEDGIKDTDTVYMVGNKGGKEIGYLVQLDPERHMEEARKIHYETLKDVGRAPSKIGGRRKNETAAVDGLAMLPDKILRVAE